MYGNARTFPKSENSLHAPTRVVELFMAGDIGHAKQLVRPFCRDKKCCVSVVQTAFIYPGGEEAGFVIGFRNYPKFPTDANALLSLVDAMGDLLCRELGQKTYMVVDVHGMTTWRNTNA